MRTQHASRHYRGQDSPERVARSDAEAKAAGDVEPEALPELANDGCDHGGGVCGGVEGVEDVEGKVGMKKWRSAGECRVVVWA